MPGRLEQATSLEQKYEAIRVLPPGATLIYVVFLIAISTLGLIDKPILKTGSFYVLAVVGFGVLLTYNRSYWVSLIFSLGIFLIILSKRGKKRILSSFILIALMTSLLSFTLSGAGGRFREYLSSFSGRFSSLFAGERMYRDETLESRRFENTFILNKIKKYPLFGIGMVSELRPRIFTAPNESGVYIHNGYLWVMASVGLMGFLPFFWFYFRFLMRSFLNWKKVEDVYLSAALAGCMLSGLGMLLVSIVIPVFMQWKSIVVIATMIGLTESILKINDSELKRKKDRRFLSRFAKSALASSRKRAQCALSARCISSKD
jgi:hypothetical protein